MPFWGLQFLKSPPLRQSIYPHPPLERVREMQTESRFDIEPWAADALLAEP